MLHDLAGNVPSRDLSLDRLPEVCNLIRRQSGPAHEPVLPQAAVPRLHEKQPKNKEDHQHLTKTQIDNKNCRNDPKKD